MNANKHDLDFDELDDGQDGNFLKKNWMALLVGALVLGGGTTAAIALSNKGGAGSRKAQDVSFVQILPPPPVVLPPPPPPPPEQEMIDHEEEIPEEAPAEDTGPSTSVTSNGPPDAFNLPKKGGGPRRSLSTRRSTVSTWAPYAGQAASRIADAMRRHSKLKHSSMRIKAWVWIDSTGRITRGKAEPTGDAAMDAALRDEVLTGLQLSGPPPDGMVMPVVLQVTARRPN